MIEFMRNKLSRCLGEVQEELPEVLQRSSEEVSTWIFENTRRLTEELRMKCGRKHKKNFYKLNI